MVIDRARSFGSGIIGQGDSRCCCGFRDVDPFLDVLKLIDNKMISIENVAKMAARRDR